MQRWMQRAECSPILAEVMQMFRHAGFLTATVTVLIVLASASMVGAETVEVYPSLQVTKHTYDAPLNEQPFYGFSPKNEAMLAADRKFIESVEKNTGREGGAEQFEAMGWNAVKNGDFSTAAKRFNQAWLLDPGRSASVHGLAVVAAGRFGDLDFAIELASAAAGLKDPLPALPGRSRRIADQGGQARSSHSVLGEGGRSNAGLDQPADQPRDGTIRDRRCP